MQGRLSLPEIDLMIQTVLQRLLVMALGTVSLVGCRGPVHPIAPETLEAHSSSDWIKLRATHLGLGHEEAAKRDVSMKDAVPSGVFWDSEMQAEAASLWIGNCAQCHGVEGDPATATQASEHERTKWGTFGTKMGFLMGGDAMRLGIYQTIRDGSEGESTMVGWSDQLSHEQIWALVWYIEGF